METLRILNPFNASVYYMDTVDSTMNASRRLMLDGEPHGTVIAAGFQEEGRGRVQGRAWLMEKDMSLPFTILLRYPYTEEIPAVLSLRTGLSVSLAIEDFAPSLINKVKVKWPNDIIINSKKAAGVLCEADGGNVYIGIGINVAQKEFPLPLADKAVSIALAAGIDIAPEQRFSLLEKVLMRLYTELVLAADWNSHLDQRLYKKGEKVVFIEGAAGSGKEIKGCLTGISDNGELLILPDGETSTRSFITGELKL